MDYAQKIRRLTDRRQGLYSRAGVYNFVEALTALRKTERYEKLAEPEAVKYAVGAMQPVDPEYTQNSFAEGERVRDRLTEGLCAEQIPVTFEYQGSVPLDVHVRGNSDIDLLVLHDGFVTVDAEVSQVYSYTVQGGKTVVEELANLRTQCVAILERRYPGATVDTEPSKAITISGGSLKRVVDVVPSHWHDTIDWKRTGDQKYRDIFVFDRKESSRVRNRPFMHIAAIRSKCDLVGGGLRKAIRLLKNLRYDAEKAINLSSYDITAICWHMTEAELTVPFGVDLLLVERARLHLRFVLENEFYRNALIVPDGSRKIFDNVQKVREAQALYSELERLADDIAKELKPHAASLGLDRSQVLAKAIYL